MKEVVTVITATITKIQKVDDERDDILELLPNKDNAKDWLKDILDADDVSVSKVKNFMN